MEFYQENSASALILVGEEVDLTSVCIMDDLFDATYVELFVKINPLPRGHVEVDTVCGSGNDSDVLFFCHQEELRLAGERLIEHS